jgi:hypothetical protein
MMARAVLLACLVTLVGLAAAPTAFAAPPCVVGQDDAHCAVTTHTVVCVTSPCDAIRVCVGYGRICI